MTRTASAVLALSTVLVLAACGTQDDPRVDTPQDALSATLTSADGQDRGTVEMVLTDDGAVLTISATGLEPGLHGLHVHKTGVCEPDSVDPSAPDKRGDFLSAGGHLAADGQLHGDHDGDLPSLLVRADGSARLVTASDRLSRETVLDADGSALMVHAGKDNFGNVPDRYAPELDATTKKTGDAGPRVACAVLAG